MGLTKLLLGYMQDPALHALIDGRTVSLSNPVIERLSRPGLRP